MDNTLHFSCTILVHHAEDLCNPKQDNTSNGSLNCRCILYNTNVQGSSGHENIVSRQDVCFHLTCSVLRHGLPKHVIQLVIHQINTAGHEERIADLAKGNQRIQKGKFTKTLQRVLNKAMKISMVKNSPRLTRSCYIQSSKSLKTGWAFIAKVQRFSSLQLSGTCSEVWDERASSLKTTWKQQLFQLRKFQQNQGRNSEVEKIWLKICWRMSGTSKSLLEI